MTWQINRRVKRVKGVGFVDSGRFKNVQSTFPPDSEQLTLPKPSRKCWTFVLPFRIWRRTTRSLKNGKWWWFRRDPKRRRGPNLIQDLATDLVLFGSCSARFEIHLRSLIKQQNQIHIRLPSFNPFLPLFLFACITVHRYEITKT